MQITEDVKKILDIGVSLTSEASYNRLLEKVLLELMEITHCDAGTLYLLEKNELKFMVMLNHSMNTYQGGSGEAVDLPKVHLTEQNVCSYCAIHRQVIRIDDVYQEDKFDFSGPRKYDSITGYHTQSMLVVPLITHEQELIGVIQLINALDQDNHVTMFQKEMEYIAFAISSLASVSLANMLNLEETKQMMYSTVSVLTTAIDEMSPFNANHTYHVASLIQEFTDYLLDSSIPHRIHTTSEELKQEELVLAGLLHDIGKLTIPTDILNKPTRLYGRMELMLCRLKRIQACLKNDYYEQKISKTVLDQEVTKIDTLIELIQVVDKIAFLSDDMALQIEEFSQKVYIGQGDEIPYITMEEKKNLLVRKGSLTQEERAVLESHVVKTKKMLEKIRFGKKYYEIIDWASGHHELLDGSGYPNHIKGDQIALQTRILTIADIYDALTAKDRPYKKALSKERSVSILQEMVQEGKLDETLVYEFSQMELSKNEVM